MTASRKYRQTGKKKHRARHILVALFVTVIVIAGAVAAGIAYERHVVAQKTQDLMAQIAAKTGSTTSSGQTSMSLPPVTPATLAQALNQYSQQVVTASHGLVSSANASVSGSTVTYAVKSPQLNALSAGALVAANGPQLQDVASQALTAMSAAGTPDPQVVIQLTDASGNVIKTLNYSK